MITHQDTSFQKAIDAAESLSVDDREELLEILRLRMAEHRRDEIAANARETLQAVREKRAEFGTVEDLKKDLLGD
jgi:predicted AAA+ superfamily ATPase